MIRWNRETRVSCLAVGAAAALAACGPRNTFEAPPPPEVTVQNPDRRDVTVYSAFPGRTEALDTIELRARVRGYLRSIEFEEGLSVEEGQVLFLIEPEPFQASLDAATAKLAEAEAARQLADAAYLRVQRAYETKAVSEIDLLTAEAEKNAAAASVLAAQAQAESAQLDLSYTEIRAPAAGRISRRYVSVGNLVGGAEATLLATLVVDSQVYVYFNVDERSVLPFLREGTRADEPDRPWPEVLLELADGERYGQQGEVDYVDTEVNVDTGTLTARAVFPNKDAILLPGLFGRVLIPSRRAGALLVPDYAVQRDMTGSYVLAVGADGIVEARYVVTGPRVEEGRIIEEGLDPGDRIVVQGVQRARPGLQVQAVQAGETTTNPGPAGTSG